MSHTSKVIVADEVIVNASMNSPGIRRMWPILVCTACAFGCQQKNQFAPPPPPTVSVAQPVVRAVADSMEFVGETRATATVDLRSRVNGYLKKILFEDGATVAEGDLLFVIEQPPFETALDAAKAELQKADAELQLGQAEYARTESLVARKAITQSELDSQAAQLSTAKANVAAAQAIIRRAELDLSYTEIRAPMSGRIGRHLVDPGNLVQAEQTLLARIESIDPIHALFSITEADVLRFMGLLRRNELPDPDKNPPILNLGLQNEDDYPHEGHLDFREFGVDPTTGTALRRGVFPNPDHELVPGLFVRIRATIGSPTPRLLVDERAIGADQRGDYLLVVNDKNVVEYRPVRLGIRFEGMRVVQEGITAQDWIVVNGLQRARPEAEVTPQRTEMNADTGSAGTDADSSRVPPDAQQDDPASNKGHGLATPPGEASEQAAPAEPPD